MGKYKEVPDWIHEASISKSLLDISNELAEANRLKRFELSQKYPQRDIHGDEKYAKAELVDQVIFPINMDKEIHYRSDTTR